MEGTMQLNGIPGLPSPEQCGPRSIDDAWDSRYAGTKWGAAQGGGVITTDLVHRVPQIRPEKQMLLTTDAAARKAMPIATGVLDYFPLALAEVATLSKAGNDQHNPGQPLHWDKTKSTDHADCIVRHLIDRGARDTDGMRHSAKLAWRALALLQTELEAERGQ